MDGSVGLLNAASTGGIKDMFSFDDLRSGISSVGDGSPTLKMEDGGKVEDLYSLSDYDLDTSIGKPPENPAKMAFEAMLKQINNGKSMAAGGKLSYEDGGEVMETPGEFSHEENPIEMIDGEGEKVGEVTGGELVFNPEQSSIIEELVSLGDEDSLMQYLKDLMNEPQFQDAV